MTRSRLPDVETLACAVAGEYAARWARSVARLQARGDDGVDAPAPWLVDGFAGADLQRAAIRGISVQPPAAAFVRAAADAFGGAARVVLVEEDPGLLGRLEDDLRRAGAAPRRTSDPADAAPGEIVLVEASFASVASRLAAEVADAPALVRLAPLSARALPWTVMELLADLSGADLLIRFPQEDFARAGKFSGPLADFPPHLRRVVEGCSAFFADERHGWLLAWREAARAGGDEAALTGTVERLRAMLGNCEERIARAARLEGAGGAGVHVLLATPHPEHALELNGAAMDGGAPLPVPSKSARRKSAPPAGSSVPPANAPHAESSAAAAASAHPSDTPAGDADPPPPGAPTAEADPSPASVRPAEADPPSISTAPASDSASSSMQPGAGPPPAASSPPRQRSAPAPAPAAPEEPPALLDLFGLEPAPFEVEMPRGPDLRGVADDLYAEHAGRRVSYRELLGGLADAGLAPEQVRTALGFLKRDRRAAYRSLDADGAEVEFIAEPAAPPPPPAPKPRKPRKAVPGVLGLFDEPEPEAEAMEEPRPDLPVASATDAEAAGAGLDDGLSGGDPEPARKPKAPEG